MKTEIKEGDIVTIAPFIKWDGFRWYECEVLIVSPCKKYATIQGKVSWGYKIHKTTIPTRHLRIVGSVKDSLIRENAG